MAMKSRGRGGVAMKSRIKMGCGHESKSRRRREKGCGHELNQEDKKEGRSLRGGVAYLPAGSIPLTLMPTLFMKLCAVFQLSWRCSRTFGLALYLGGFSPEACCKGDHCDNTVWILSF